jgi:hypothetical protein
VGALQAVQVSRCYSLEVEQQTGGSGQPGPCKAPCRDWQLQVGSPQAEAHCSRISSWPGPSQLAA